MPSFQELANPGVSELATYEPGRPIEEVAREMGFERVSDIIKLASNENSLGPSPLAIEAIREQASSVHEYPDGGSFRLRDAIGRHLGLEADMVLPGNGSNELIELLGHVFMAPARSIVMADYAFIVYRLIAASFGARVRDVPMRAFTHDLEAMSAGIEDDTSIVFIANPNNPTGTRVTSEEIARFMDTVPAHVIVCFDEAYIELIEPDAQTDTLRYVREGRKVIVLRTFSKTYGLAGLRIGYGLAAPECIQLLNRARQPFNVNQVAQVAACAALEDNDHVVKTRSLIREGVSFLEESFVCMGLEFVASCVNFVMVKVGEGQDVFKKLLCEGVIVRPMRVYGLPEYIRVTVGTRVQNERFVDALKKVLKA